MMETVRKAIAVLLKEIEHKSKDEPFFSNMWKREKQGEACVEKGIQTEKGQDGL